MAQMNKVNDNPILSPKKLCEILTKLMNKIIILLSSLMISLLSNLIINLLSILIISLLNNLIIKQNKALPILKPKFKQSLIAFTFKQLLNRNQSFRLNLNQPNPTKLILNHPNRLIKYLMLYINNN